MGLMGDLTETSVRVSESIEAASNSHQIQMRMIRREHEIFVHDQGSRSLSILSASDCEANVFQ